MKNNAKNKLTSLLPNMLDRLVRDESNLIENRAGAQELALPEVRFVDKDYPDDDVFGVPSCCFDN
jgi:hypothetical protein